MVVEDFPIVQEVIKEVLGLEGHNVIFSAFNGQEAIDYFLDKENELPDLVLMDHRMPGKDGITTMKEIFEISDEIIVVFISADPSAQKKALDLGAVDYLIKPLSIKSFIKVVNKYTM